MPPLTVKAITSIIFVLRSAVLVVKSDGTVVGANPAAGRQLQKNASQLCGTSLAELSATTRDRISEYLRACLHTSDGVAGSLVFRIDGSEQPYRCHGSRLPGHADGGEPLILLECSPTSMAFGELQELDKKLEETALAQQALTRQKEDLEQRVVSRTEELLGANVRLTRRTRQLVQAVHDLATSEAFSRSIVDNAADGIVTIDAAGTIESVNIAAEDMFGYRSGELIGKNVKCIAGPPHRDRHDEYLRRYQATGEKKMIGQRREAIAQRKDGTTFPIVLNIAPITVAGKASFTALVRDISEERRVAERLRKLDNRLLEASRASGMAEVASGILHNVGNVLNSIGVSVGVCQSKVRHTEVDSLKKIAAMCGEHEQALDDYFSNNPQGRRIPEFLAVLADHFTTERDTLLKELASLRKHVDHIKAIVSTQQNYTRASGSVEAVSLQEVVDDAIDLSSAAYAQSGIAIVAQYQQTPRDKRPLLLLDRHKILQVLLNLLANSRHAVSDENPAKGRVTIAIEEHAADKIQIRIKDNGVGIAAKDMPQLFSLGYTTKDSGHGYGLHTSVLAAEKMAGALTCHSEGRGRGATFVLELPVKVVEAVQ